MLVKMTSNNGSSCFCGAHKHVVDCLELVSVYLPSCEKTLTRMQFVHYGPQTLFCVPLFWMVSILSLDGHQVAELESQAQDWWWLSLWSTVRKREVHVGLRFRAAVHHEVHRKQPCLVKEVDKRKQLLPVTIIVDIKLGTAHEDETDHRGFGVPLDDIQWVVFQLDLVT